MGGDSYRCMIYSMSFLSYGRIFFIRILNTHLLFLLELSFCCLLCFKDKD